MGDGDILPTLTRHLIRSVPHTLTQGRLARSKIKKKNKKKSGRNVGEKLPAVEYMASRCIFQHFVFFKFA